MKKKFPDSLLRYFFSTNDKAIVEHLHVSKWVNTKPLTFTQSKLKEIKDFSVKYKITKLPTDNIRGY